MASRLLCAGLLRFSRSITRVNSVPDRSLSALVPASDYRPMVCSSSWCAACVASPGGTKSAVVAGAGAGPRQAFQSKTTRPIATANHTHK